MPGKTVQARANKINSDKAAAKLREKQAKADQDALLQQVTEGTDVRLQHLLLDCFSHTMVLSSRRMRQHQLRPSMQSLSLARSAQGGSLAARLKTTC
jgi:hypothetical protein